MLDSFSKVDPALDNHMDMVALVEHINRVGTQ